MYTNTSYDAVIVGGSPALEPSHLHALKHVAFPVIACDHGADVCEAANVAVSAVIGDMDSIAQETLHSLQNTGVLLQKHPAHKDETDFHLALRYAQHTLHAERVLVFGAWGGRIDHSLGALGACLAYSQLAIDLATNEAQVSLLTASNRSNVRISKTPHPVSIIALCPNTHITAEGFEWNLNNAHLEVFSDRGVSNQVVSENAQVTCEKGAALVVEVRKNLPLDTLE